MAEDYLTDDEQLEHVKRLAAEYGPWMAGAIVLGLALVVGYRYYLVHQNQRALAAATQFDHLASAVQSGDQAAARQSAEALIKGYPGSPYADQAQLELAALYVEQGQDADAVAPLTRVMEHSKDMELRRIARLRLARVLIDQGKPDDALNLLAGDAGAFAARYHEVRGDAYFAKKDPEKAAQEYRAALAADSAGDLDAALLTLKLADLGVPATPVTVQNGTPAAAPGPKATP